MYLGIDLGTSGLKAVLLDERHAVHAEAGAPLAISRPRPLWSEQEPAQWWQALGTAMARLREQAGAALLARVRAIGLSGQMHGAVLLDAAGEVLRPALLWNDGRAHAECAEFEAAEPRARTLSGNLAMPGFTAPKLLWLRRHEPAVFARVATVLLPKDWLRWRLTGERVSDMSDASGTLWLDVAARRWSAPLLAACGLHEAQMPRLVEGSEPSGVLRADLAADWGLPRGVVVAGGAGDNAASAVGVGAVRAGEGFVSLGTSGVVFLAGEAFQPAPERAVHAFAHALPGRWHQMSVMLSAASAFGWAARLTGRPGEAALAVEACALAPAVRARAPLFLPYLSGERTPHNDAAASGVLFGLRPDHGAAEVGYAVMEGVCFGLRDGLDAMRAAPGQAGGALALVGGGAHSDGWAALLASVLGRPLWRDEAAHEAAAVGAARLGWLADGGDAAAVCARPAGGRGFEPEAAVQALVAGRLARFRALYPALRQRFAEAEGMAA